MTERLPRHSFSTYILPILDYLCSTLHSLPYLLSPPLSRCLPACLYPLYYLDTARLSPHLHGNVGGGGDAGDNGRAGGRRGDAWAGGGGVAYARLLPVRYRLLFYLLLADTCVSQLPLITRRISSYIAALQTLMQMTQKKKWDQFTRQRNYSMVAPAQPILGQINYAVCMGSLDRHAPSIPARAFTLPPTPHPS